MSDFVKYEALGNDYLIIDPARTTLPVSSETVMLLCDRHRGVGADGVLWGPLAEGDALRLRIFNSDGSECAKSGNGLRIFAHYVRAQEYVRTDRFLLRTLAGDASVEVIDFDAGVFKLGMGSFSFDSKEVPAVGPARRLINERIEVGGERLYINCVNIGNPHCVVFCDDLLHERIRRLGPAISRHPLFPNGINVQMAKVNGRTHIDAAIWERGSGYTLASGSSACAIVCVAHALDLVGHEVIVHMPGGDVSVSISPSNQIFLTGEVCPVAEGRIAPALQRRLMMHARLISEVEPSS